MPAADTRLAEFVDWASANGVPGSLIGEYRRVAGELLGLSGGGRVTESHILRLIDSYSDRAGGRAAVNLIEDVGEAMLRHESARKLTASGAAAAVSPAPAPFPTPPVVTPAPTPIATPVPTPPPSQRASASRRSAETFTARPSERISVELKPPSVSREAVPPSPLVSFAPTPDQPLPPVSPLATPPPMAPPAPASVTSSALRPRRRPTSQFRCLKCKTMVAADDTGVCPRCGTAAPRISSAQMALPERPLNLRWVIPAVLGLAAFVLAYLFGPGLIDRYRHPSEAVGGTGASPHLGVRHTFPDGWRHSTDQDRAPTSTASGFQAVIPEPVSLRSARFFRGSPSDPGAELMLSVAPRPATVSDDVFHGWANGAAAAPATLVATVRELSGLASLRIERCVVGNAVPGGGMRCVGGAGRTRALVYAWPARTVTAVAVFLTLDNPDSALAEANELIAGLDLS